METDNIVPCCNKCYKDLDANELKLFDSLAMMTGYHPYTLARCCICKKPVCIKCMYGHGLMTFSCIDRCTDIAKERFELKPKSVNIT